jgi:hypothetical protein
MYKSEKKKEWKKKRKKKELKLDQFLLYTMRDYVILNKIVSFSSLIDCFYLRKDLGEL